MYYTETTTEYLPELYLDDFPASPEYTFRKMFRSDDPTRYVHEHMCHPRNEKSWTFTKSKWGRNIWDELDRSQKLGAMPLSKGSARRVSYRYHALVDYHTEDIEMVYFDLDTHGTNPEQFERQVEVLKTVEDAIWCRSPGGGFHVFVLTLPWRRIPRVTEFYEPRNGARNTVLEWLASHKIKPQNNLNYSLNSILIPGQDCWTLPCEPGHADKPIASNYNETIALFAAAYENRRLLWDVFPDNTSVTTIAPIKAVTANKGVALRPKSVCEKASFCR